MKQSGWKEKIKKKEILFNQRDCYSIIENIKSTNDLNSIKNENSKIYGRKYLNEAQNTNSHGKYSTIIP